MSCIALGRHSDYGRGRVRVLGESQLVQLSSSHSISASRPLLNALGRKYDQYQDFAQQDAHEFLRILLDAMRMEEFDVRVLVSKLDLASS